MSTRTKIRDRAELAGLLDSHRRAGRRIVFTNGGFDLLHVGHVRALEEAASHGGVLVVAVNDDASVRAQKGPGRPLQPAFERAELVAALGCVDYVTVFGDATVDDLLRELRPHVHAKGRDYTPDTIPERGTDLELGIDIAIVGDLKLHSSTQLLARAAATLEPVDRVSSLDGPGRRGLVLRSARRALVRTGWLDLERLVTADEGAVVERHATRFVRRQEIGGHPVYVKVTWPAERRRSPLAEFQNHLALRAAGFRAPEPWLCLEGVVRGRPAGVLVTREAPGLALDEYLALALADLGPRQRLAVAKGIGFTIRAMHTARFFHKDLQAWHILVDGSAAGGRRTLTFIDLARLERAGLHVRRKQAAEGLAALALSLEDVTTARFRLEILRAYLGGTLRQARPWLAVIGKRMQKLRGRGTFRQLDLARAARAAGGAP